MNKFGATIAKIGISLALLGFLGWKAYHDPKLPALIEGEKDWFFLLFALFAVLAAVLVTILRWHLLLRTLGLQFSVRESLRAGFMGYLFNLMPLGLAGADAVKAGFLIHRNPSRKTEAIASVIVDRILGLYALLVMAGVAALLLERSQPEFFARSENAGTLFLCRFAQYLALGSTIGFAFMLIPGMTNLKFWDTLERVPGVGGIFKKLVAAMRTYRQSSGRLLLAVVMSFAVHCFYVAMVFFVGRGLCSPQPSLATHFVFVPISMVAGALPIGAFEATLNGLYYAFSPAGVPESQGLLIAVTYRLLQASVATIGVFYYLTGRQEVKQLLDEQAEAEIATSKA
ncbi:YbhN family protein [Anatilimnocola sp. NA78]|uniref:lysylphosphatidylglycerol synthase transmembrane domain-containing protein n=1 Tax=Anatilimnocola sp. NA78 TaxID=3415683 RepID=UPI003CE57067